MSIADSSRGGSVPSMALAASTGRAGGGKHQYLTKLDRSIEQLAKITLGGGATGKGHESASNVAKRLGEAGHVFSLLERCLIETKTTEEGLILFRTQMAERLKESWKGHYAGKPERLQAKVDEVIHTLMTNAGPYTEKLARRAGGFKEALIEVGSKGLEAVANENEVVLKAFTRNLEDRILAIMRHRSEGSSMETTRLVSALYEGYGASEIAKGGPIARLHKLLCKSEMREANPRELQFLLIRNLAERFHKEKGYKPEDANRKAFHIVQELFERGKSETAAQLDYIHGYIEAVGVNPGYIQHQRDLRLSAPVGALLAVEPAGAVAQAAQHFEALSRLRRDDSLDAGLRTALSGLSSGTSSAAIVDKIVANPELVRGLILTCIANADVMGGAKDPVRGQLLSVIEVGFSRRFIEDDSSVLRSVITAGRKPIQEKLAKVCEALTDHIKSKMSDEELLDYYKQVASLRDGAEAVLSEADRAALSRGALDRGVSRSQQYEKDWASLETLVDNYMNKKSGGSSYQSSDVVMAAIFGDTPELGQRLVKGYYSISDDTNPTAFQLEFYHRMQAILARKDEAYYFRGSDKEAGNRKTKDLFSEFMKHLGVTSLDTLAQVPFEVGATRHLSAYEVARREALRENMMGKASCAVIVEARAYFDAQLKGKPTEARRGFDEGVLGEYGVSFDPGFMLVRSDSRLSLASTGTASSLVGADDTLEEEADGPLPVRAVTAADDGHDESVSPRAVTPKPSSPRAMPPTVTVRSTTPPPHHVTVDPGLDTPVEVVARPTLEPSHEAPKPALPELDHQKSALMAAIKGAKKTEEEATGDHVDPTPAVTGPLKGVVVDPNRERRALLMSSILAKPVKKVDGEATDGADHGDPTPAVTKDKGRATGGAVDEVPVEITDGAPDALSTSAASQAPEPAGKRSMLDEIKSRPKLKPVSKEPREPVRNPAQPPSSRKPTLQELLNAKFVSARPPESPTSPDSDDENWDD